MGAVDYLTTKTINRVPKSWEAILEYLRDEDWRIGKRYLGRRLSNRMMGIFGWKALRLEENQHGN